MAQMLIDAANPAFTRMVIRSNNGEIQEFEQEFSGNLSSRSNIYLATVTRVEPSLQAAFINYGNNRNGFLPFHEIHPDYFRIPIADRRRIIDEQYSEDSEYDPNEDERENESSAPVRFRTAMRRYKIQEVVTHGQVLLVQVIKEERGNKGAAVSTYMSLAGRYCVLMPNDPKSGGISRKITDSSDRRRLRNLLDELPIPESMSLIIRTAGGPRDNEEIRADFDYLVNCWNGIRKKTLESHSPSLIHADGELYVRAIRDHHDESIDNIFIDGEDVFNKAFDLQKQLMPFQDASVVLHNRNQLGPIFQSFNIERKLASLFKSSIDLPSGGYVVIHQTEALVAIDVNSGKATGERDIEGTALNTNLEAAYEIARQLRLRDLAGLVVIDFIDMVEYRNVRNLERRIRDFFRHDRARVQIRNMSQFGMMEMSRQRIQSHQNEHIQNLCPHCSGSGYVFSSDWITTAMLRMAQEEASQGIAANIVIETIESVRDLLLNNYRNLLIEIEEEKECVIQIALGTNLGSTGFRIWRTALYSKSGDIIYLPKEEWQDVLQIQSDIDESFNDQNRRKRQARRGRKPSNNARPPRKGSPSRYSSQSNHEDSQYEDNDEGDYQDNSNEDIIPSRSPSRSYPRSRIKPTQPRTDYDQEDNIGKENPNDDFISIDEEKSQSGFKPRKPVSRRSSKIRRPIASQDYNETAFDGNISQPEIIDEEKELHSEQNPKTKRKATKSKSKIKDSIFEDEEDKEVTSRPTKIKKTTRQSRKKIKDSSTTNDLLIEEKPVKKASVKSKKAVDRVKP